jgi:SAM-dependent methyltransferase
VGPKTITTLESSWWEKERLIFLSQLLEGRVERHLDIGCGRGDAAARVTLSSSFVVAVDAHLYPEWRRHADVTFVVADVEHLPFRSRGFERVVTFDVLEHLPDDRTVLSEMERVVAPHGQVLITVPANPHLWSEHDERVGHFRRYRRHELANSAKGAGLVTTRATYFFSWLHPIALMFRSSRGALSGDEGGRATARLAGLLCRAERRWLRRWNSPFGTSLLLQASASEPGDLTS